MRNNTKTNEEKKGNDIMKNKEIEEILIKNNITELTTIFGYGQKYIETTIDYLTQDDKGTCTKKIYIDDFLKQVEKDFQAGFDFDFDLNLKFNGLNY